MRNTMLQNPLVDERTNAATTDLNMLCHVGNMVKIEHGIGKAITVFASILRLCKAPDVGEDLSTLGGDTVIGKSMM